MENATDVLQDDLRSNHVAPTDSLPTKTIDNHGTNWRYFGSDSTSFGDVLYTTRSPERPEACPHINDAQNFTNTDFFAAPALYYNDDIDDNSYLGQLEDVSYLPGGQNVSQGSIGLDAQGYQTSWPSPFNADHSIDRHDCVSLQDVELHKLHLEYDGDIMQQNSSDLDASFGLGDIERQTRNLDKIVPGIVQQSSQLPQRYKSGQNHGCSGHDRLVRSQVPSRPSAVIKDWYFRHSSSPYPSPEQIVALATLSSRSEQQVKICLSNLRARAKAKACMLGTSPQPGTHDTTGHFMQLDPNPSFEHRIGFGIDADTEMLTKTWADWYQFKQNHSISSEASLSPGSNGTQPKTLACTQPSQSSPLVSRRKGRRQHASRFERTFSEPTSSSPHTSADSGSNTKKLYHCTVCRKSFKDIYGWKRHESSVHGYSDIEWICMLGGTGSPGEKCFFCSDVIHDFHHFEQHDTQSCLNKSICDRTFTRKDLLKQHVQQKHLVTAGETVPRTFKIPQAWSQEVEVARIKKEALWCGFCLSVCDTIGDRMDHVAEHFRNGDDIGNWIPYAIM